MTAPTPGSAPVPAGTRLTDGFQCLITFAADTDISLFQLGVTPPGVSVGDAVPTTTFHNTTWETSVPPQLKSLTEAALTAAYDPAVLDQIIAIAGVATTITLTFITGATWAFYGFLKDFKPNGLKKGDMPLADVTIQPTNTDASGKEEAPVYTAAPT